MEEKISNKKSIYDKFSTAQIIILGFLSLIILGTILLKLPISINEGKSISTIDALFTATSAVCVTGLSTINVLNTFSFFGKAVILVLIQVGGLGFMMFVTTIYIFLHKKISLKNTMAIEESTDFLDSSNISNVVFNIMKYTFSVELLGVILLSFPFTKEYGIPLGIFKAIFHSISAFCNAGFDTIGYNSLAPFVTNYYINFVIMLLIFLGGIGFFVIIDISNKFKNGIKHKLTIRNIIKKLSLHTKIVLLTSFALILLGTLSIYLIESFNPNTIASYNLFDRLVISLFQSISARTAGFATIDMSQAFETTKLIYIILMLVGGSPSSTAGGIKTTTLAILVLSVYSMLKNETNTTVYGRTISNNLVKKAMVMFFMAVAYVTIITLILMASENCSLTLALFEVASAFATVGTTLNFTSTLTFIGRVIIIITMFIGRVGLLTLATSMIAKQSNKPKDIIKYPEEKILMG